MKKHIFGRKLKRDTNERKALLKGLSSSLVLSEKIITTEEKAKAVKPYVEKLVTKAKKEDAKHVYSLLQPYLNTEAVRKMLTEIAPRFKNRPGGYTRIIKVGNRFSDNASLVSLEWVERKPLQAIVPQEKTPKTPSDLVKTQKAAKSTPSEIKVKQVSRKKTTEKKPKEKVK